MASKVENNDDESFIILGPSPGTSLDMKCNGIMTNNSPLKKKDIEDAIKDLSVEASMAFKAQFQLGDCPSPSSMMVASAIVSEDKSTQDLQKKFGEILDENLVLKETLKQNNESLKEQFLLIASCQDDMLKTHKLHQEKFDETKALVEKLRQENKKLKLDIVSLVEGGPNSKQNMNGSIDKSSDMSAPSSTIEFVTSPDDDTINKLTSQLELVEKQRRQIIVENDKLTWQKESLEKIVDSITKERDDLKIKLNEIEMQHLSKEEKYVTQIDELRHKIEEVNLKMRMVTSSSGVSDGEIKKRDDLINQMQEKNTALQNNLITSQLKILELENIKLELSRQKAGTLEVVKGYKEQINVLNNRLKEVQTVVFQPIRFSISSDQETSQSEYSSLTSNVKLYDRTIKHLSDVLNAITNGTSDCLMVALGILTSLDEFKFDRTTIDNIKTTLSELKNFLEKQHSAALNNMSQVKATISIFEGIFKDHKELLKKTASKQENKSMSVEQSQNVSALTTALMARGEELNNVKEEVQALLTTITALQQTKEDDGLLQAQIEIYKADFEAERESREKMASEKEILAAELRTLKKKNQQLTDQLDGVLKINPETFQTALKPKPLQGTAGRPTTSIAQPVHKVYKCPKCMRFSTGIYEALEEHLNYCLDF